MKNSSVIYHGVFHGAPDATENRTVLMELTKVAVPASVSFFPCLFLYTEKNVFVILLIYYVSSGFGILCPFVGNGNGIGKFFSLSICVH